MSRYLKILLPVAPLALGLILAITCQAGFVYNPILFLRADLGSFLLGLGLLASIAWGSGSILWALARRRCEDKVNALRREQAEAHWRFIRRLDHELKNPLTAIHAGLANLMGQVNALALASVRTQVDRLARLSAELRKLADLEAQPLEVAPVDLSELLSNVLELIQERPGAEKRHWRLTLPSAPWPLPPIAGDRDLLFLAAHNLVDNAYKFSRPQDTIEIRAFEDGAWVVVEVADTGPGIPDEELPHLGEELYRGSAARSVEGSGLGLALVQAIVARHKGTMAIRSRLGQGTVVNVRLPLHRTVDVAEL